MKIISWNISGAVGTDFRRAFRNLCLSYQPNFIILYETKVSRERANNIISSLGFSSFIKVDALGFSGGIWVLWNPNNIIVEPIGTAFHKIHFKVQDNNNIFILTALYASPTFSIRKAL